MTLDTKWETPEIINKPPLTVDSTQFYDNKEDTCSTARDRKNRRIADNSRVNTGGDCPIRNIRE